MTQDAQGALRRIMEQYSRITRFCLICNYVTRYVIDCTHLRSIIEPLASRCSKFRFRPLDVSSSEERLAYIAQAEGLRLNAELIPALIRASGCGMRRSIAYLKSVARLASARGGDVRDMSAAAVGELAGLVPENVIESLARAVGIEPACMEEDAPAYAEPTSSFDQVYKAVHNIAREGYSSMQVVLQVRCCHSSRLTLAA